MELEEALKKLEELTATLDENKALIEKSTKDVLELKQRNQLLLEVNNKLLARVGVEVKPERNEDFSFDNFIKNYKVK
jgi:hypothetical protein